MLHLDSNETFAFRISVLVTSASLHNNQLILLIKLTCRKVMYHYDLMDAAYHARLIEEV